MAADWLNIFLPKESDRKFLPLLFHVAVVMALVTVFAFVPIVLLRAYQGAPIEIWGLKFGTVEKIEEEKKKAVEAIVAIEKAKNELRAKDSEIEKITIKRDADIAIAKKQAEIDSVNKFYSENSLKNYWFWRQTKFPTVLECNLFFRVSGFRCVPEGLKSVNQTFHPE